MKLKTLFNSIGAGAKKHSPEILTGLGIAGMVATVVLAVKATPKALELIDEAKCVEPDEIATVEEAMALSETNGRVLKPIEVVKVAWKPYIPAMATGLVSIACLISAQSVSNKRYAALTAAYEISTTTLKDYRSKVKEIVGEEKEKEIRKEVVKDKMEKNPANESTVIVTGGGSTLCYDAYSDRYFESDVDKIRRAVNTLNWKITSGGEMYISLNEFYDEIGLKHTTVGETVGWRPDKGLIDICYGSQLTENDRPCVVIEFLVPPEHGFDSLY